ncbi:hypothetical protein MKX01_033783 [Papaver californicum]|nr:hypothetical protein MKX01_033783 [Papaver californicum]
MDAGNSSLETIDFDLIIERFTSYFSTSCTSTDNSEELPLVGLRALVVDDSTSCRLITSLLLKKYDYQVTGVSGGFEALKILREKPGYFDLVVSDVHMPEMCGLQLLQCIMKEFPTLPVFLISGDNDREMVRRGIESGATFYLTKPLKNSDVEKLWQHVFTRKLEIKNMKQAVNHGQCSLQHQKQKISIIDGSSSKANEQETVLQAYQSSKGKKPLDVQLSGDKRSHLPQVTKNGKGIVWTETLQSRFLQAVEYMGVKDAEPKQILDHMKVPGLTLKNVATHLQVYF